MLLVGLRGPADCLSTSTNPACRVRTMHLPPTGMFAQCQARSRAQPRVSPSRILSNILPRTHGRYLQVPSYVQITGELLGTESRARPRRTYDTGLPASRSPTCTRLGYRMEYSVPGSPVSLRLSTCLPCLDWPGRQTITINTSSSSFAHMYGVRPPSWSCARLLGQRVGLVYTSQSSAEWRVRGGSCAAYPAGPRPLYTANRASTACCCILTIQRGDKAGMVTHGVAVAVCGLSVRLPWTAALEQSSDL